MALQAGAARAAPAKRTIVGARSENGEPLTIGGHATEYGRASKIALSRRLILALFRKIATRQFLETIRMICRAMIATLPKSTVTSPEQHPTIGRPSGLVGARGAKAVSSVPLGVSLLALRTS